MDTIDSANEKTGSSGIPFGVPVNIAAVPLGDRKMRR